MAAERFIGTAEFIRHAREMVRDICGSQDTCYITEDGHARAVLLDIQRYNALMDLVEEAEDPRSDDVRNLKDSSVSVRAILAKQSPSKRRKS